ncbi:acyltransferase family protein [Pseudoalteromonas aurantia]|uniref:Acyltransferase n=1 Tax=Pseudoalteromonas aurantia TaxID=43654 RepID=A0A5S3VBB8_9GAMM|nr:acyltransferase family protein [Pseudoalteromonas aurantia]TMO69316.1 acyltransferase [Pseudoalteromonas aurantia]
MKSHERLHYMDNIRAIALMLGIIYHASLAYSPFMANIWFTADSQNHAIFDTLSHWLHLFRMPVFFIIAGFFAGHLIEKKGIKSFLSHRLKRLVLPFMIFFPILAGLFLHAIKWGSQFPESLPAIFTLFEQSKNPSPSTMHLWFLWNLFGFSVLFSVAMTFKKSVLPGLKLLSNKWVLLSLLPCLVLPALYSQFVPFPAPDKFTIEYWSYGFYGIFFSVGSSFYFNEAAIKNLTPYTPYLCAVALISYACYLFLFPKPPRTEQLISLIQTQTHHKSTFDPHHFLLVVIQSISIVYWSLLAIVLAYKFLQCKNTLTRYISDASYWVYLIHVPILIYIQMPLLALDISIYLKFLISVVFTLATSFASYHLLIRFSFMGKLLNGKKYHRNK